MANDGRPAIYSQTYIETYKSGKRPYTHPNISWTDELLRKNASFNRYTVGAEGASKYVSYAMSLDHMNQQGLLKPNDVNPYSTNSEFQRYIFRTNIKANLSDNFNVFLNLFGRIRNTNDPGSGTDAILEEIKSTPSNAYPIFNPNKSFGGNVNYQSNLFALFTSTGYTKRNLRDGFVDAGFNVKLDNIIEGWWVTLRPSNGGVSGGVYSSTVNMNASNALKGVILTNRQNNNTQILKNIDIEVSNDGTTWQRVVTDYESPQTISPINIGFNSTIACKYFKVISKTVWGGAAQNPAVAEINAFAN